MKIGNLEVYGVIYKITNKVNGKVYIGITTREGGFNERYWCSGEGIERVYNYHKSRKGNINEHLLKSIEKYGFKSFQVCQVFDVAFSESELYTKEKSWISIFKSNNNNFGYNKTYGGSGNTWYENESNIFNFNGLNRNYKPVYCINNCECIKSIAELNRMYDLNIKNKNQLYNKKGIKVKNHEERLKFKHLKYKGGTPIICLNNGEIYKSIRDLNRKLKNNKIANNVKKVCNGEIEFIKNKNKHLYFCYAEDYFYCYETITSEDNLLKIILNYNKYVS